MIRSIYTCFILVSFYCSNAQITLTESNLPIIVIESLNTINADSKVAATMKIYFKEDGSINKLSDVPEDYDGNIGIKQRGQTSLFIFDKKGYSLETRDILGEENAAAIMGMPKEVDWILHGPYSDKSLMRNALMYTLADSITPYAPRVQMAEVMINNEYQGVYLFTEKIKRDGSRVDIAKLKDDEITGDDVTGGYILKFDKGDQEEIGWVSPYSVSAAQPTNFIQVYPDWDDIVPEQKEYIQNWMTNFEDLLSGPDYTDDLTGYRKSINTESFIDFMLLNEMSRNVDAYRLSTYMFKDKDSNDDELHMGPVWDYNLAFGNANYCDGSRIDGWAYDFNDVCNEDMYQVHFWWKRLLTDATFEKDIADKWMKLRNGKFSNSNLNGLIDHFEDQLAIPQVRNFQKWDVLGTEIWPNSFVGNTYASEVQYLRTWLMDRLAWMDNEFDIDLSSQDINTVDIRISPNPVNDILKLSGESLDQSFSVRVYDLAGQIKDVEVNNATTSINVSALNSGMYLIQFSNDNNQITKRFIKM
jgi:hypothetical protein